jgi:hypothetical protein
MCAQVLLPAPGAGDAGLAARLDQLERRMTAQPRQEGGAPPARPEPSRPEQPAPPARRAAAATAGVPEPAQRQQPAPARPRSGSGDRNSQPHGRPAPDPDQPAQAGNGSAPPAAVNAPAAAAPAGPLDTSALRARWPEVLAAVQREKRVAWMQLSNASVESFADGVLTLAFAQAGVAKGFTSGGYEKDLGQVLAAIFGITPRITAIVGGSGGQAPPGGGPRPGAPPASPPPPPAGPKTPAPRADQAGNGSAQAARPPAAFAAVEDTDPADQAAPEGLTGMDLIARELGGRVIEEIGGP